MYITHTCQYSCTVLHTTQTYTCTYCIAQYTCTCTSSSTSSLPTLEANQGKIVESGGLEALVPLLSSKDIDTVTAAVAALRNLSIRKGNEVMSTDRSPSYSIGCTG